MIKNKISEIRKFQAGSVFSFLSILFIISFFTFLFSYKAIEINHFFNYSGDDLHSPARNFSSLVYGFMSGSSMYFALRHEYVVRCTYFTDHKIYQSFLRERKSLKIVMYATTSILFLLYIVNYYYYGVPYFNQNTNLIEHTKILKNAMDNAAGIAVMFTFLPICNLMFQRDLKFKISRVYLKSIDITKTSSIDKIKYLIGSIETYNSYLNQKTRMQINNLDKVYSKLILDTPENVNKFIKEFEISLESIRILPTKKISEYAENLTNEEFLSRKYSFKTLKDLLPFLATVISGGTAFLSFLTGLIKLT